MQIDLIVLVLVIITIIYWHHSWVVIADLILSWFLWLINFSPFFSSWKSCVASLLRALKGSSDVSIILCNVSKCYSALFLMFTTSPRPAPWLFAYAFHGKSYFIDPFLFLLSCRVWYLLKFSILRWFLFSENLYCWNSLLFTKRAETTCHHSACCRPVSALNKQTATTLLRCKLSIYLNKKVTRQTKDFNVQRPSVLNRWSAWLMQRGVHLSPLPHRKHNHGCIRDNFLRKWILQIFSFCCFPSRGTRVSPPPPCRWQQQNILNAV